MRIEILDVTPWSLWFAWYPVTVYGKGFQVKLWMCNVLRRRCGVVYEYQEA